MATIYDILHSDGYKRIKEAVRKGYGRRIVAKDFNLDQIAARAIVSYAKEDIGKELENDIEMFFLDMPHGIDESVLPYVLSPGRVLVLSDIHFPFHHKPALIKAIEHGRKIGVSTIILNGDAVDCNRVSRYTKEKDAPDIQSEKTIFGQFLEKLRHLFPNANIIWKKGNHEVRWEVYLMSNAPELISLAGVDIHTVFDANNWGVIDVAENQIMKAGPLTIAHGHEYKSMFGMGINPARTARMKGAGNILFGHVHRKSYDMGTDINGVQEEAHSTGCLRTLCARYSGRKTECHGYAIVEFDHQDVKVDNIMLK